MAITSHVYAIKRSFKKLSTKSTNPLKNSSYKKPIKPVTTASKHIKTMFAAATPLKKTPKTSFISKKNSYLISRKTKKQKLPIAAQLDLHGYTPSEASHLLNNFFYQMRAKKKRHLLIITGKGKGVMKQILKEFLIKNNSIISHQQIADLRHGGSGATYIILKKSAMQ
ncbi:MAG: Smr/MutS family protein [Alphaproteobacteria bacterium]